MFVRGDDVRMSTIPRRQSERNVYHLVTRGIGQQILFEDDTDRTYFLTALKNKAAKFGIELLAWCIMSNHAHLIVRAPIETVSRFMGALQSSYALYHNKRHERSGRLFQSRFTSVPIENDEQLIAAVRYVHLNPVKVGEKLDSPWSSYGTLASGGKGTDGSSLVLDVFGGTNGFRKSHVNLEDTLRPDNLPRMRLSEDEAIRRARETVAPHALYDIKALSKAERNKLLKLLKAEGLSVRQITRCTGIGQNIVARA